MGDPFLFFGHGYGTSARNLEAYLWFERPPGVRARAQIERLLPRPVAAFCRFDGVLAHLGSDDDLEARVRSRDDGAEPTKAEWRAFCADFEAAVRAIHERHPLVAVLKADDGAYGRKTSTWHRRSVRRSGELAIEATDEGHTSGIWLDFAMSLLEDVLRDVGAATKQPAAAREPWLRWLDALASTRRTELRDRFVESAAWVLGAMPARKRQAASAQVSPAIRGAFVALPDEAPRPAKKAAPNEAPRPAKKAASAKKSTLARPAGAKAFPSVFADVVVTGLRAVGYAGSRTKMRRPLGGRTHVLWFDVDDERSVAASVSVGLAALAVRKDSTLQQDYDRALGARQSKQRRFLSELLAPDLRGLFWYEDAQSRWGRSWRSDLAAFLLESLEGPADRWLRARGRTPKRKGR